MKKENLDLAVTLRRELHAHPELSSEEVWTRSHIQDFLKNNTTNLEIVDRGLWFYACYHAGADRPTIAFRADFDALPLEDGIDKPYRSQFPGRAHKCGHDGHAACLAGLCLEIDRKGSDKNIVFVFQHAEEIGEGAQPASAIILEKNVREIYAFHNYTGGPPFTAITRDGIQNCASVGLSVFLKGKLSHASEPEKGVNPVFALSEIALKVPEIVANENHDGLVLATIVGLEVGGENFGISPDSGVIRLTLRTEMEKDLNALKDEVEQIAKGLAEKYGVAARFEYRDYFPENYSHKATADKIRRASADLGFENADAGGLVRASEDFGWYTKLTPGSMFVMCGDGPEVPLHSELFDFDENLIEPVVSIFEKISEYPVIA